MNAITPTPRPRGKTIRLLQQISFVLSWSIFLVTLAGTIGWSGFWITLAVSVLCMPFEKYLLYRGTVEKREEKERARLAFRSATPGLDEKDAESVTSLSKGPTLGYNNAPSTASGTLYQLPWIVGRVIFTGLWMCGFAAVLVILVLTGPGGDHLHSQIMELILAAAQVGVMIALSVLTIKERKRVAGAAGA